MTIIDKMYAGGMIGVLNPRPWGRTFYVSSTHVNAGDANLGTKPRHPLATLAKAFANCLAGDRIIIGARHVETISAQLDMSKSDVEVLGLGGGVSKPTFTFDTIVGASLRVWGKNNVFENLRFVCGIDGQDVMVRFQSEGGKLLDCDFSHDGAVQPLVAIECTFANQEIAGNRCQYAATGVTTVLEFLAACDNIWIHHNQFSAFATTSIISATGAATKILIEHNDLISLNTTAKPCIIGFAALTGSIRFNTLRLGQDAQTGWITTPGAVSLYKNDGVNNDGETGILVGTPSV